MTNIGKYEAVGPEANELRQLVAEALDEHLNPGIIIVDPTEDEWERIGAELGLQTEPKTNPASGFDPEDEEFFASRPGDFEAGIK